MPNGRFAYLLKWVFLSPIIAVLQRGVYGAARLSRPLGL